MFCLPPTCGLNTLPDSVNTYTDVTGRGFLPGAIMISFFLERTRRNVRSFWGSMSRMVLLAFITSWWMRPAYCTVLALSSVVLMGIPGGWRGNRFIHRMHWITGHFTHPSLRSAFGWEAALPPVKISHSTLRKHHKRRTCAVSPFYPLSWRQWCPALPSGSGSSSAFLRLQPGVWPEHKLASFNLS